MLDPWKITLLSGWFKKAKPEQSQPLIEAGNQSWPIRLVLHPQSRRYRLVFDDVRGELRLTMPLKGSQAKALKWAAEQQQWISDQAAKAILPVEIGSGSSIPFEGEQLTIVWNAEFPRMAQRVGQNLQMGGPRESVGRRTERWLRAAALVVLEAESRELAEKAGLSIGKVGIGDPRGRWGSCTAGGDLRYSWRLILAPNAVRRATVAHEVAHLRHMDHSVAFHDFVQILYEADVKEARQWLRAHGRALHRYRFTH